ncbi:regulatory protein [Enterococcus sp. AZ135]|uniref:type IV conjugative transfer system protein TraE n=1 Tax=unclassified Enterococcus TaxID=2608891 RepID=UPI003F27DCC3
MRKTISVEEIGYYGKRVTVFEKHVKNECEGVPYFRKTMSHYRINGLKAEKIETYFEGKLKRERVVETVMIHAIYRRIKHVYDHDNVLIARRNDRKQPLRITGKGMSKFLRYG